MQVGCEAELESLKLFAAKSGSSEAAAGPLQQRGALLQRCCGGRCGGAAEAEVRRRPRYGGAARLRRRGAERGARALRHKCGTTESQML